MAKTTLGRFEVLDDEVVSRIFAAMDFDTKLMFAGSCGAMSAKFSHTLSADVERCTSALEAIRLGSAFLLERVPLEEHMSCRGLCTSIARLTGREDLVAIVARRCTSREGWLIDACRSGDRGLIKRAISSGAKNWDAGLRAACEYGHKYMAEMMLLRGATNLNSGLRCACYGEQCEIVEWLVDIGATDLDSCLCYACYLGNREVAEMLVRRGACVFDMARDRAFLGGHNGLAELMAEHGAKSRAER